MSANIASNDVHGCCSSVSAATDEARCRPLSVDDGETHTHTHTHTHTLKHTHTLTHTGCAQRTCTLREQQSRFLHEVALAAFHAATAAGGVLGKDDDALYFITLFLGHLAVILEFIETVIL